MQVSLDGEESSKKKDGWPCIHQSISDQTSGDKAKRIWNKDAEKDTVKAKKAKNEGRDRKPKADI